MYAVFLCCVPCIYAVHALEVRAVQKVFGLIPADTLMDLISLHPSNSVLLTYVKLNLTEMHVWYRTGS